MNEDELNFDLSELFEEIDPIIEEMEKKFKEKYTELPDPDNPGQTIFVHKGFEEFVVDDEYTKKTSNDEYFDKVLKTVKEERLNGTPSINTAMSI